MLVWLRESLVWYFQDYFTGNRGKIYLTEEPPLPGHVQLHFAKIPRIALADPSFIKTGNRFQLEIIDISYWNLGWWLVVRRLLPFCYWFHVLWNGTRDSFTWRCNRDTRHSRCLCQNTGWPIKNGTAYFLQNVDALNSISVWGNFSWENDTKMMIRSDILVQ